MNIGATKRSTCLAASLLALASTVVSADDSGAGAGLEGCLAAALKQRPGFVHEWKQVQGASDESYKVAIINSEGKIADTVCIASAPGNFQFEDRIGLRRYDSYARINVSEESARKIAPVVFVGPVKIVQMAIDLDWRGHAAYEYHMILPTGREAMAHIDTVSGVLVHAEVMPQ